MEISVVIPAINEAEGIAAAVDSASSQGAMEVLVVDGGSQDDTVRRAQAAGARVVTSPSGRARQQNAGAALASGQVLLFLHADNRLGPHCLEQIREAFERRPQAWGGAFRHRIDAPQWLFRCIEWGDAMRVRWRGLPFGDQGLFIRREAFEQVGGFPDEPLMEDLLLARRMRRTAWPLLLPGPVWSSPRRWQRHGVVRQTVRNWSLQVAHACGCSPDRLAAYYRRHDGPAERP
ncbi:TIGR04283 family arsenosugar biosynthesis glycosyltransferase [Roseimaritima ulvae]|uniref:Glucosyl-3-phosphoglycerate synthase n=1 Tax=Roseimaritima ulvae TaxID=980254 RepID=A0A5B9QYK6_9BACT|nr:TIGR04283 family arsenosugar biosynthesis glycosyltransferase [Roseimaritima ulvae]QEG42236.1 Glucosyl-3-phosphoglycerate synthase [Roseimaritima ulvae]